MAKSDTTSATPEEVVSTDVAIPTNIRRFTDVQLHDVNSFDDALALLEGAGFGPTDLVDATDIGDGFVDLDKDEKMRLVGQPFIMLQAVKRDGDFGEMGYYTCHVVTKDGRKYRFSDGSTGIARQLRDLQHGRKLDVIPPMVCKLGLSYSTYPYEDPNTGVTSMATTFYLDTAQTS